VALGEIDLSSTSVGSELGQPSLDSWSTLIGFSAANKFSRYAPGGLGVDGNKNITYTAPDTNYKMSEYRLYNHTSLSPTWHDQGTIYHYPGTTTKDTVLAIAMESLNLQCFATNGIDTGTSPAHYHVKVDVYDSSAARITGTSPIQSIYPINVNMTSHSPLSGHSRQSVWVMNTGYSGNLITCNSMNCGSGDLTRYIDCYFCDTSGNRIINFGTSISTGYYDINFHEQTLPLIYGGANTGTDPGDGGWTGYTYPRINSSSGTPAKCSWLSSIALTFGDNAYSFYLGLQGIRTSEQMCSATADIRMTRYDPIYGSEAKVIATGVSLLNSGKIQISGTLSSWSKGNTWFYDESATITIENITYGAYSPC
jgi:hypothetical protein